MKQNVFNLNTLKAHPERNAFDLSHNDVFSCAPGQLLPISVIEVLPNEHYQIKPDIFLRTMPLNSAAYVRLRQHIEFFFVPMRTLCRQFNQFVVGTKYPISNIDALNSFTGSLPTTKLGDLVALCYDNQWNEDHRDGLSISNNLNHKRLYDLLGYGINSVNVPMSFKDYTAFDSWDTSVSLLRLAAYQKIYSDFYRNPYYESVDTSSFNLDDIFGQYLAASTPTSIYRLLRLSTLRYRNWKLDYFTSVQPSFQGAPFVTRGVDMSQFNLNQIDDGFDIVASTGQFGPNDPSTSRGASLKNDSDTVNNELLGRFNIPVHNIRAAFALDKLLRLQQQAGNGSYGEQIRNRFGFGGVHDDWKATFIGGTSAPVSISEVITTANTTDAGDSSYLGQTGDIYGKAVSSTDPNSPFIEFDTKEHGIIMGIFSVAPEADYNSFCLDRHNMKLRFEDFFQPEFERLGKQPLSSYELTTTKPQGFTTWTNRVIGFQNRYLEYKTKVDKVHGQFCSGGTLSAWSAPRNSGVINDTDSPFNLYSLKVSPKILNSICSVAFNGNEGTDPILVDSHIMIKAIRPISVSSEPLLN
ncbi:major capsid protein [Microvirus sp.]|nr:major capsid protein [Microvirus sp.]